MTVKVRYEKDMLKLQKRLIVFAVSQKSAVML